MYNNDNNEDEVTESEVRAFDTACNLVKYLALAFIVVNELFGFGFSNWINIVAYLVLDKLSEKPILINLMTTHHKEEDDDDDDDDLTPTAGAAKNNG